MAKATSVTTATMRALLRQRYSGYEWAVFEEVANETGSASARVDMLAVNLWRSRGYSLTGIEIKVSRPDWLREKKNPKKAEFIGQFCDFWYLAIGFEDVIGSLDEVPEPWGVLCAQGNRLVEIKKPRRLKPKALKREFVAALARNACKASLDDKAAEEIKRLAREEGYKKGQESTLNGHELRRVTRELRNLEQRVAAFEAAAGISLTDFRWDSVDQAAKRGEILKHVLGGGYTRDVATLERMRNIADELVKSIDQGLQLYQDEPRTTAVPSADDAAWAEMAGKAT